jgi:hypothetical protein
LITVGPDGNFYFTNLNGGVDRFSPANGDFSAFPVLTPNGTPEGLAFGPDGNPYVTEQTGNKIALVELNPSVSMPTNIVLTAAADPSVVSNSVTFTAVESPQSGSATPTGSLVFTIDGTAQPAVGLTVLNGQATATFTTSTLSPGRHLVNAAYSPSGNFAASSSSTVVQDVIVTATKPADGPEVVSVIPHCYRNRRPTLLLTFNEPLDPATAQNVPPSSVAFSYRGDTHHIE